jgi:pimeloyl-ACP methyl ester carboxylesterase
MFVSRADRSFRPTPLQALSAADTDERIEVGGAEIAVKCWGRGQPVLCLHGAGHASGDFELMAERLKDDFEIIALDWPGHGFSPDCGRPPSAAHYATLIEGALDALHLDRPALLGAGIGGSAALIAAARHPERYAALVLCNAPGLAPLGPVERFACDRAMDLFRAGERGDWWFEPMLKLYYGQVLRGRAANDHRRRMIEAGAEAAPLIRQAWEDMADSCADLRPLAERARMPVWLAWAGEDRLLPWATNREATRLFRKACATRLRGGRAAFLEDPDAFAAAFQRLAAENL